MPWIRKQFRAHSSFNNMAKQLNHITFTAVLQRTSHCKAQSKSNLMGNGEKILFSLKYRFLNPAFFCFRKPLKSLSFSSPQDDSQLLLPVKPLEIYAVDLSLLVLQYHLPFCAHSKANLMTTQLRTL